MKILALLSASCILLLFLSLLKIKVTSFFTIKGLNSVIALDYWILAYHSKIEINIPEKLLLNGISDFVINLTGDFQQGKDPCKTPARTKNKNRYRLLKHVSQEALRHYIVSISGFIHLKKKIAERLRAFYQKIAVHSLEAEIALGGSDAAETGLLTGICWILFGWAEARVLTRFTVKKRNIHFQVIPDFAQKKFISRIHCILTIRISHIIFIVYQLVRIMIKNRRNRRYGRTSHRESHADGNG